MVLAKNKVTKINYNKYILFHQHDEFTQNFFVFQTLLLRQSFLLQSNQWENIIHDLSYFSTVSGSDIISTT